MESHGNPFLHTICHSKALYSGRNTTVTLLSDCKSYSHSPGNPSVTIMLECHVMWWKRDDFYRKSIKEAVCGFNLSLKVQLNLIDSSSDSINMDVRQFTLKMVKLPF